MSSLHRCSATRELPRFQVESNIKRNKPNASGIQPPLAILLRLEPKNKTSSSAMTSSPASSGSRAAPGSISVTKIVNSVVIIIVPETAIP
jgi:hypothetical protein